jgi:hypothetical protein
MGRSECHAWEHDEVDPMEHGRAEVGELDLGEGGKPLDPQERAEIVAVPRLVLTAVMK